MKHVIIIEGRCVAGVSLHISTCIPARLEGVSIQYICGVQVQTRYSVDHLLLRFGRVACYNSMMVLVRCRRNVA